VKIFLSYASEDRVIAEEVHLALSGAGHDVFFDRDAIRAGAEFHARIRSEIIAADAMVFLISPSSLAEGCYTLSELKVAREKWPHPKGRLLPISIAEMQFALIPSYLRSVTVMRPEGNLAAEAVGALAQLPLERPGAGPSFARVSDNEIVYPTDISTTQRDATAALNKLGRVTKTDEDRHFLEGKVWHGLKSVRVRVSLVERDSLQTGVVIQAVSDDAWNAGGRSATKRFIEVLAHLNTPGYKVDRRGVPPGVLFGILVAFVVAIWIVVRLVAF
jgi:hypothetical protein